MVAMMISDWFIPYLAHTVVGIELIGVAIILYLFDRRTAATRALTLILMAIGFGLVLHGFEDQDRLPGPGLIWRWVAATLEMIGFYFGVQWVIQVRKGTRSGSSGMGLGHWVLRFAQGLILASWIVDISMGGLQDLRWDYLFTGQGSFFTVTFWVQALPVFIGLIMVGFVIVLMAFSNIDRAEGARITALLFATPFLATPVLFPPHWQVWIPITVMIGLLIFGAGSVRYALVQGRRGQMMSRFLSPDVASLVKKQGLEQLLKPKTVEITALACDIRGFTAYAKAHDSVAVMEMLKQFYRIAGSAAAAYGGTVKDHAGDGVLILFGAPLDIQDHTQRGLLAAEVVLRELHQLFTDREITDLGIGAGLATGPAAVGAIEGGARLEYAAVGTVVNLSARLCSMASDGEIYLADESYALLENEDKDGIEARKRLRVKGIDTALTVWRLDVAKRPAKSANIPSMMTRSQRRRWKRMKKRAAIRAKKQAAKRSD